MFVLLQYKCSVLFVRSRGLIAAPGVLFKGVSVNTHGLQCGVVVDNLHHHALRTALTVTACIITGQVAFDAVALVAVIHAQLRILDPIQQQRASCLWTWCCC